MKLSIAFVVIVQALAIIQAEPNTIRKRRLPDNHSPGRVLSTRYDQKNPVYIQTPNMCIDEHNAAKHNFVVKDQCELYCTLDQECKSFDWREVSDAYNDVYNNDGYNCAIQHVKSSGLSPLSDCTSFGWSHFERISHPYTKSENMCIIGNNAAKYNYVSKEKCALYCDVDDDCKSFDWRQITDADVNGYNCAIQYVKASADVPLSNCASNGWSHYEKN